MVLEAGVGVGKREGTSRTIFSCTPFAGGGSIIREFVDILVLVFLILFDLPHPLALRGRTRTSLQTQSALDALGPEQASSLPDTKRRS